MPGKWTKLRGTLEKFQQDASWQQDIDKAKLFLRKAEDECRPQLEEDGTVPDTCPHGLTFQPLSKIELCQELDDADNEKVEIERKLKTINTVREALNQVLLAKLEGDADNLIKNSYGTFYIQDDPYASVQDKMVYLQWIRDQGLEALFSVPWQSTNAQVKSRLEANQEPPPGIKVYIKSTVRRRNA